MANQFYDTLAADYDRMIPWEKRLRAERPWFEQLRTRYQVRTLLDASCGSGRHLALFAELNLEVSGADASTEMVSLARQLAADRGDDWVERLYCASWSELPDKVPGVYDAVLCIGNSLPYVRDTAEFRRSLAGLYTKTAPGGRLLLQFKNFARLYATRQPFLPVTSCPPPDELIAIRKYDYHPDSVDFTVIFLRRNSTGGWDLSHQATPLRPYRAEEVVAELSALGPDSVEVFGSLALDGFDVEKSEDVVIVATRPRRGGS